LPQINKRIVNGQVEYSVPHHVDEDGRYDGRQILDV
jgi:ribosomal protein L32